MNIGLGLISIPFAIIFILLGLLTRKNNDKFVGNGLLVVGTIIFSVSILLILGILDPYAKHIR